MSYYDYWTQKEAFIKAHGMGLSIPLKSFEISNNRTEINKEKFILKEIKLNIHYKCHLAVRNTIHKDSVLSPLLVSLNLLKTNL